MRHLSFFGRETSPLTRNYSSPLELFIPYGGDPDGLLPLPSHPPEPVTAWGMTFTCFLPSPRCCGHSAGHCGAAVWPR